MDKVKLPREIAVAIENLRLLGYTDYQIAWNVCGGIKPHEEFKRINHEDGDMILRALYIGYEVETTPEEKVRQHFENLLDAGMHNEANVIHITLDNLNIKIEGVNA